MSANPYESPGTSGTKLPHETNWKRLTLRALIVVAILALLVALFLPAFPRTAREAARRMQCSNNLKHIGLALRNYHDEYQSFPPAYVADSTGKPMHSWRVLILPYLEQKELYNKYKFDEPWNGPNNSKLHNEIVRVFCCPSRVQQSSTDTSYVVVTGPGTAWPGEKSTSMDSFKDGTSDALLVVEMAKSSIHWMEPRDLEMAQMPMAVNPKGGRGISSSHPNVALAVFPDGHTAPLTCQTSPETIRRLLTIADGEPVGNY